MFSGLCFMVNEKCVGVEKERFDGADWISERCDEVDGKRRMHAHGFYRQKWMKGYVFVDAAALKSKRQLDFLASACTWSLMKSQIF